MTAPVFALDRVFDAPREQVFQAHAELDRLSQWWGPKGFAWVEGKLDFRPGGLFHYRMRAPNGADMWGRFAYREIATPERIVFLNAFSDPSGAAVRAPFAAGWPLEVENTLTFEDLGGRTRLSLRGSPHAASPEECALFGSFEASMAAGFGGTLDQLADYLAR